MDPKEHVLMMEEWQAWQKWHKEFTGLTGIDINDKRCDRFAALTRKWGDRLVALRMNGTPQCHADPASLPAAEHL